MNIQKPLNIIESAKDIEILRQMYKLNKAYTGREMARLLAINNKTATAHLELLWKKDILKKEVTGRSFSYRLNQTNLFVEKFLRGIFDQERKVYKNILLSIKKKLEKFVTKIILYGSYARGEQTYTSDLDICLVVNKKIPSKKLDMLEEELLENYGLNTSFLIKTEKEYKKEDLPILKEIKREGIVI